ncbi:MAG TPA: Hpt domain-containing protein [Anaerolineae bacterium]|nr:Hpt domain-containing protein [Anaerolineae bacterium]
MDTFTQADGAALPTLDFDEFQKLYTSLGRRADQKLATLVASFIQSATDLLAEAREALAVGDRETLHRAAHTLKATAAMMGAPALSGLARDLEWATKERLPPTAVDELTRVEAECLRVCTALAAVQREVLTRCDSHEQGGIPQ